jgi:Zn-finger protein
MEENKKKNNSNMEKEPPHWKGKNYSFFNNKDCEYFPCHKTADPDNFNCLFCFCPLFALKDKCGGNFVYNEKGIKDCSNCNLPHNRDNYGYIMEKFNEIMEITKL